MAPPLFVVGDAPLLRADEQVFEAMVQGWSDQQLSRGLRPDTVSGRTLMIQRFQRFSADWPWAWRPVDLDEFTAELRGERKALPTIRAYQGSLRQFLDYVSDPRYEWSAVCERLFGTHPVQICFEWNTVAHAADYEGRPARRSLTKVELQTLFDHADEQVAAARTAGRKGWLAAMRDSAALKVAYAWGLRRRELVMLELADIGSNPKAPEFATYGVLYIRWGKASRGSPPRRRSVLTVFPWSVRVLQQWITEYRDLFAHAGDASWLWPTERSGHLDEARLSKRFGEYRDAVRLPTELTLHCLRHSYVTHLIEAGYDPLFVQQQVGHSYASTTALYTSVSANYRSQILRQMLDKTITDARSRTKEP
jgi:integrase/recombinase XerC